MSVPFLVSFGLSVVTGFIGSLFMKGRHVSEPLQTTLRLNNATYGVPIPVVYGINRVTGNIILITDFQAIQHTETQRGGKGIGPKSSYTYYTYTCTLMIGLCEGQIDGISRVWINNNIDQAPTQYYVGALDQEAWPYLEARHPELVARYPGLCYYCRANMDLGGSPQVPQFSFEVRGKLISHVENGANPADVIVDLLSNTVYGVGLAIDVDYQDHYDYCDNEGLHISPVLMQQTALNTLISEWLLITNSDAVVSGRKLILKPLCETPVGNWVPDLTAVTIDENDVLEDPEIERAGETSGRVTLTYLERENNYNQETVEAWLQSAIMTSGQSADSQSHNFPEITSKHVARKVAQLLLQQSAYPKNVLRITVPWRYIYLEPLDLISYRGRLWRIDEITEEGDDRFQIVATEVVIGLRQLVAYDAQIGSRYAMQGQEDPGNTTLVVVVAMPTAATATTLPMLYAAVAGESPNWGGCEFWVSTDGDTYYKRGRHVGASTCGTLAAALPNYTGTNPDTTNQLVVHLENDAELLSITEDDAATARSLLYVDGEFISYEGAAYTGTREYTLSTLYRGLYGSARSAHAQGAPWCKLDASCLQFEVPPNYQGATLYVKLLSFNRTYQNLQSLADVEPYEVDLSTFSSFVTVSADYTITSPMTQTVFANCDDNDVVITLPAIGAYDDRDILFKRLGSIGYTLTVQAQGGALIDGAPSLTLSGENETVTLTALQGNWYRR